MKYTRNDLINLLQDKGIATTGLSYAALVLLAVDNNIITREDVIKPDLGVEKKPRGRPRKYPPKEVDPDKVVDPKYHRLRTIRTNPKSIKLTNVETGEVESYDSLYKAYAATRRSAGFLKRHNGEVVDGKLISFC